MTTTNKTDNKTEVATFAAGCFWGVEQAFREVEGVTATAVGYEGGHVDDPTYRQVCSAATGHAEVVRVEFDPAVVSYDELLDVFWRVHNPTTLNRQGPDVGDQYRSAIFCEDDEQRRRAEASRAARQADDGYHRGRTIVTQVVPAATFWRAEEYHQQYVAKGGRAACATSVAR